MRVNKKSDGKYKGWPTWTNKRFIINKRYKCCKLHKYGETLLNKSSNKETNTGIGQGQYGPSISRSNGEFGRGGQRYGQVLGRQGCGGHNFHQIKVETIYLIPPTKVNDSEYIFLPDGVIVK